MDDTARRQRAKGDNKKLVRWGETKNIPNTPKPIEWQRAKEDKKRAIALHKKSHTEPLAKESVKGYDPKWEK